MSTELKSSFFYSVLSTQYSALVPRWQISAGQFFELMLPVSFALCALLSTWVLASARRRRFSAAAVILWTLSSLIFPLIVTPLYLIARSYRRRREKERANQDANDSENQANERSAPPLKLRRTLPLAYLLLLLSLGALYFYMDSRGVETHLSRANQARVQGQRERVIAEYRAALALEDDAHTHNLLGQELAAARRFDEALAEFRTAERMGELDDELSLNTGIALDQLNHPGEAKLEYERFLNGSLCTELPHDARCTATRRRLTELAQSEPR